jgi:hypothetical protein
MKRLALTQIHKCILGSYPKDERILFTEKFVNTITQRIATRGILKLRTPKCFTVDIGPV